MKLYVLGTGHATVIYNYNTCFCLENNGKHLLVDGGGGKQVLTQLAKLNLDVNKIDYAFISHNHTDHLLGMVWIVRTAAQSYLRGYRTTPLTIYGSKECLDALTTFAKITLGKHWEVAIQNNIILLETISNRDTRNIIDLEFEFFDTKAEDMPQMAFCIPSIKFAFCGDVPLDAGYYNKFNGYNYICIEAFCTENKREQNALPLKKHYTALQAAKVAKSLNCKNTILWHGEDNVDGRRKEVYIKEAQQVFDGNILVPEDLDIIELKVE